MAKIFVEWEELFISNDKGRRVVHYYLKDSDGGLDLAVVGKEKSLRHMVYTVPNNFLRLADVNRFKPSSSLKWRSRREVVDWLSSLISDSLSYDSSPWVDGFFEDEDACPRDVPASKGLSSRKLRHHSKDFSWSGSPWTCRKRRKHYRSFRRNGITLSVHDFVYVMVEENRRLVAYLEDLYEDSRANKMVVVRWFHKIDEVGIFVPPIFNDREIFFSLCLQDLSVECIDGLATVLGPQHFEKFLNEATDTLWEPYLCHRQIDNDDVKPFDITQVQGYWNQKVLRYMYTTSPRNSSKPMLSDHLDEDGEEDPSCCKPQRKHGSKNEVLDLCNKGDARETVLGTEKPSASALSGRAERSVPNGGSAGCLLKKEVNKQKPQLRFSAGCLVEVLSQDSGIRGCWFRAAVLKRHENKVKVRYQDLKGADDAGVLEEWVLASRVAMPDELGVRFCGRTTVRPYPPPKAGGSCSCDVGTLVDAWWFDGWWEGIIFHKESEEEIHVYFPGEHRTSVFSRENLRQSQDWLCNKWNCLKHRLDLVSSILLKLDGECMEKSPNTCSPQPVDHERLPGLTAHAECSAPSSSLADDNAVSKCSPSAQSRSYKRDMKVPNLAKDDSLAHLRWNSSKKRRRGRESFLKRHCEGSSSSSREDSESPPACKRIVSMKADHENCKYGGDLLFVSSMPPPLSSLVMSR